MGKSAVQRYTDLKESVENLKAERAKNQGAQELLLKRLSEEFDCTTIEEADTLLANLDASIATAEKQFEDDLNTFEEKYAEVLV